MTAASLAIAWLQLLALLAAEVGLIAVGAALLARCSPTAAWRRTFCQAGITAVLVVTACELSGSARVLGAWAAGALTWKNGDDLPRRAELTPLAPGTPVGLNAALGSESEAPFAGQTSRPAGDQVFTPRHPIPPRQAFPASPAAPISRSPDSVSDSMGVLWLCLIWATGAALAGLRACLAQCLFVIFQFRRRPVAEPALAQRVQALGRMLGIRRRVRVIESRRLTGPIAFGLFQPTVGVPQAFAGQLDPAKRDAMLAHELAHLAAHDPFWCLLADVATVVLWWHPGVWWLRRQLHLASEMAADEASLLVADGPRVLAECLVELGARLTRPVALGQLRVSGFRSHLGRRVQQLVRLEGRAWSPPPRLGAAMTRIFGPMAMTAIVVLCTAWAAPQALTKGDSMKTMQLNWKRSLATFALLAAFNGSEATVAVAQSDKPQPSPAPAPQVAPAAPAAPADSGANSEAAEAPLAPKPPPAAAAGDAISKRYGLGVPPGSAAPDRPARGAELAAKLQRIVLPEVTFDGLPLSEVLSFLRNESAKRDPDKAGVNFLINPNFRPVALTGREDPATGLPLAATPEQFDMGAVLVKFNQPLRDVTMKDLLDAIVTVADHPIEYTVEDYAVVFSAKPETVAGQPVILARPGEVLDPPQAPSPKPNIVPIVTEQAILSPSAAEQRPKRHWSEAELSDVKPQTFNIDFGSGAPSKQVGPAAAGRAGDFWNTASVAFNDHHTESDLKFAGGNPSPIEVEMINLGGGWSFHGAMGVKSPMLDTYNYPAGNKGGNSTVILHQVPAGKYNVYIYGHGPNAEYYGDYTLSVGDHKYGRKQTSSTAPVGQYTKWVEGIQYVRFSNVKVGAGGEMEILIQPGARSYEPSGRNFCDAMICGLQLIPVK